MQAWLAGVGGAEGDTLGGKGRLEKPTGVRGSGQMAVFGDEANRKA